MSRPPRAPNTPPETLTLDPGDIHPWSGTLLRVAMTQSTHVIPYGTLRAYGPVPGQRWEPHPPGPPRVHALRWGVLYTASTLVAACAETGQRTRTIDRHTGAPVVTTWRPTRPLHLLDLGAESTWLIRHGASSALTTRPAAHCRTWAHHIADALGGQVDGLHVPSVWTGTNVVLFGRAADSFPQAPTDRVPMNDPALFPALRMLADRIGYRLI